MSDADHQRRRFLIDSFQYRFLGITMLYLLAALAIFSTAIFLPLMVEVQGDPLVATGDTAAASQFLTLHARFWPALGVTLGLLLFHAIITSHRIAGPLYRFRATYKQVAEGELFQRVGLRKNDYLGKDAHALNLMIAALRDRIRKIRGQNDRAAALLPELRDAVGDGEPERIREILGRLSAEMEHLDEELAGFCLEAPGKETREVASDGPEARGDGTLTEHDDAG